MININIDGHCEKIVTKTRQHTTFTPADPPQDEQGNNVPPIAETVEVEYERICNGLVNTYSGQAPFEATCPNCNAAYRVTVESLGDTKAEEVSE